MANFFFFLMQGIPEATGIAAFCLALAGSLDWRKAIGIGSAMTLILYVVRHFEFNFGIHTAIGVIIMGLILVKTAGVSFTKGFFISAGGFFAIAVLEYACTQIIFKIFALNIEIIKNTFIWKLIGLPQAFLLMALALIANKVVNSGRG